MSTYLRNFDVYVPLNGHNCVSVEHDDNEEVLVTDTDRGVTADNTPYLRVRGLIVQRPNR